MPRDPEQFLISLANLPRREYMERGQDRAKYLVRMRRLLSLLDHPEQHIPHTIHVAGTSGKGSVCTFLHAVLKAGGKKTGLMISPHPSIMRERWQVNERIMGVRELSYIIKTMKKTLNTYLSLYGGDPPSLFDIQTAIGFLYFAQNHVEWAVIEVGLGGRFDSTNVIAKKDIAVITSIGLDHTEILGNTKTAIAKEKTGIITRGCDVFTLEKNPKVLRVIEQHCRKKSAPLHQIRDHELRIKTQGIDGVDFEYKEQPYSIAAIGKHQTTNAALVIDIAHALQLPESAIKQGLAQAVQPIRMEVVSKRPFIIIDGAHNPDKMKTTIETVQEIKKTKKQHIHVIVGFSADKDTRSMVRQLALLNPASIACTRNTMNPFRKVASPGAIATQFRKLLPRADISIHIDPLDALADTIKKMKNHDILLVTGSIFLSGELRPHLTQTT